MAILEGVTDSCIHTTSFLLKWFTVMHEGVAISRILLTSFLFLQKHLWHSSRGSLIAVACFCFSSLFLLAPLIRQLWRGSRVAIFLLLAWLVWQSLRGSLFAVFFQLPFLQTLLQIFHCCTNDNCNRNNNKSNNKTTQNLTFTFFSFFLVGLTNQFINCVENLKHA